MAELIWQGKANIHRYPAGGKQIVSVNTEYAQRQFLIQKRYEPEGTTTESPLSPDHWYNRLIWGDKKDTLPALLHEYRDTINLIYIDPPFMTGRTFNSGTQIAYSDTWNNDIDTYLQWLYETLYLLHQLLAPTGSLYIHLDWRASHYARLILDEIFGTSPHADGAGFKNEIIWHYQSGGRAQKFYARKHDTLLLYSKSAHYCFHGERVGERRGAHKRNHMRREVEADGQVIWTIRSGSKRYTYNEDSLITPSDVWSDISHLHQRDPERTGYATQKPEALLERVLLASSEEDDIVLDCFCGSGVTPVVAERLGRRWIACDKSELAIATTQKRLLTMEPQRPFVTQYLTATETLPETSTPSAT
jgi:site-specific DNA-methyltransferase (adenine-specific)